MKAIYNKETGVICGVFNEPEQAPADAIDLTEEQLDFLGNSEYVVKFNGEQVIIEENAKEKAKNEMLNIKYWFDHEYAPKEQKYRRLHTLGDDMAYGQLLTLYREAEIKRARYNELEKMLEKKEQ